MNTAAKPAYLTIYYDYIDGHPAGMEEVKPVWLDAAQCGTSEIGGRSAGAKFDFGNIPSFRSLVTGAKFQQEVHLGLPTSRVKLWVPVAICTMVV